MTIEEIKAIVEGVTFRDYRVTAEIWNWRDYHCTDFLVRYLLPAETAEWMFQIDTPRNYHVRCFWRAPKGMTDKGEIRTHIHREIQRMIERVVLVEARQEMKEAGLT